MRTLTLLAAITLAAPLSAQTREDLDARAHLALCAVKAPSPAMNYADAVAWTHLTHRPVLVSVRLDCRSLCGKVRGEIPAAHVQALAGDSTPRMCLVCADSSGQLWQSGACWVSVPAEATVRAEAADLARRLNPPKEKTRLAQPACICGEGQCKCPEGDCPGRCPVAAQAPALPRSSCPGGVCPAPTARPRGLIRWQ